MLTDAAFDDGDYASLLEVEEAYDDDTFYISWNQNAGDLRVRVRYRSDVGEETCATYPIIAEDTNYRISFTWIKNDTFSITIDAGAHNENTFCTTTNGAGNGVAARTPRTYRFGMTAAEDAHTFQVDNFRLDDDAAPSICTGDS